MPRHHMTVGSKPSGPAGAHKHSVFEITRHSINKKM